MRVIFVTLSESLLKVQFFDRIIGTGFVGPENNILERSVAVVADSTCNWDLEQHRL